MMTFTIEVPNGDGNIGVRTVARDVSPREVKPMLRRAIEALEAEMQDFDKCPWHGVEQARVVLRGAR